MCFQDSARELHEELQHVLVQQREVGRAGALREGFGIFGPFSSGSLTCLTCHV